MKVFLPDITFLDRDTIDIDLSHWISSKWNLSVSRPVRHVWYSYQVL